MPDPRTPMMETTSFRETLSLVGGAPALVVLFTRGGGAGFDPTLIHSLFNRSL
ncbi:MAG: hypothetical protein ABIJ48_07835 [Actinomycetota bacterium]